jgi:DNA-binding PadR family transcriptional regulator
MADPILKYLPLSETTAYTLLSLAVPLHGDGIMQKVEEISQGTVKLGPGTLYGAFSTLESEGLIVKVGEADRRKTYTLTEKGRQVIKEHIRRCEIMAANGKMTKDW